MAWPDSTISVDIDIPGLLESTAPCLFLAFQCDRPTAAPERYLLDGVGAVEFGRSHERGAEEVANGESARLDVRIPDPTMSSVHAELRRAGGGWELTDAGSKNGTLVNGERCASRLLADGDLLEMGRTLFLFRRAMAVFSGSPHEAPDRSIPGMATLIPALEAEFDRVRAVAKGSINVTIVGQSGTGKELLAGAIHRLSGRAGSFVAFNCGAVPPNLIASELFGYRKGAFSGAEEDRPGLIRSAEGGTLFLDEVGELAPESQVALLRVLQEREVLPLGTTRPVKVNVRFLSATSQDLSQAVASGRFRPDLHARLAAFTCRLPPLAERREDMGLIVAELLRRHAGEEARLVTIAVEAARVLWSYPWPGNVRELDNCVSAALLLARGGRIGLAHLPPEVRSPAEGEPSRSDGSRPLTQTQVQRRERLVALLKAHAGNVSAVARELGKERVQVQRWLKRFEIDPRSFRC
jgi:sigma-54 dependent transcriptional regulator, acetoin dehydrogenase operon transcriptional activator AcoR